VYSIIPAAPLPDSQFSVNRRGQAEQPKRRRNEGKIELTSIQWQRFLWVPEVMSFLLRIERRERSGSVARASKGPASRRGVYVTHWETEIVELETWNTVSRRTIKILQSMCLSHKIVETYKKPACAKSSQKGTWNDALLQSLCVSHKIVETYRNLKHVPKFSKGKMEWCANGSTDQSHLRMWHLLRTRQNIGQAPWAFDRMDMCTIKVFYQSINQSIK
jgi:hypothetical protein